MSAQRSQILQDQIKNQPRNIQYPKDNKQLPEKISSFFGCNVFGLDEMAKVLPSPTFKNFLQQYQGKSLLDKQTADAVAHAAKVWAMQKGATHFTHWFQPQTNSTAEKHDSFLSLKYKCENGTLTTTPVDAFSGSQLIQAEPDASSFPHGGARTTFEARGYTVWDTHSPMFIQDGPHGTSVLYIPSVFISYHGDALDEKTVLLRSNHAISTAGVRLLRLLGDNSSQHINVSLGTEQEFFLVDRAMYRLRPDLRMTGRTLIGNNAPKHQQLEDHYFGTLPARVLAVISESEYELWKLGVPLKTRHNEVAPSQFEVAPVFEEASIAVDHNLLTMDIIQKTAHKHGLKCLFHEKPFANINGSGKHCNWSICTDSGENLLEPGETPEENDRFLLVLVAILKGVLDHSGLLSAAILSASNEHRLGGHEAPPAIISAFLGEHLSYVLDCIEKGTAVEFASGRRSSVKVGATSIDMKVSSLPKISKDTTDRNRTSPFAFTGNKFEFRAVGSQQSPSFPMTILNGIVAGALNEICEVLEKKKGSKEIPSRTEVREVIKEYIALSKPIRFEGDGYSGAWANEASQRNLLNLNSPPDAYHQLSKDSSKKLLTEDLQIFSEGELKSRYHVLLEKYGKDVSIEAKTLLCMLKEQILPTVFKYRNTLSQSAVNLKNLGIDAPEIDQLMYLSGKTKELTNASDNLQKAVEDVMQLDGNPEVFARKASKMVSMMRNVRDIVDDLEQNVDNADWPFPKYLELLF